MSCPEALGAKNAGRSAAQSSAGRLRLKIMVEEFWGWVGSYVRRKKAELPMRKSDKFDT
jgi:hypothetical protein